MIINDSPPLIIQGKLVQVSDNEKHVQIASHSGWCHSRTCPCTCHYQEGLVAASTGSQGCLHVVT